MNEPREISLLKIFSPSEIRNEIFSSKIAFSKNHQRNKNEELRELKIHLDNANYSGLLIDGGESSINVLSKFKGDAISILAGRNDNYFFKLYINEDMEKAICFILIKRRKHTEEELQFMAKKLGIKNIPRE
ncbi:hypothetical protein NG99_08235 [Erwinia typographi]|uniref:Uncharacterized protein n=1 Tax=Erwinia typographi TaxID=371042 RepID=A0A0A3Z6A4_9GAMM|nr:hypothetical protein [Erwinia typographi]KGT94592.1 hypothetical protein NG99_08235 [Erwinia typographi]